MSLSSPAQPGHHKRIGPKRVHHLCLGLDPDSALNRLLTKGHMLGPDPEPGVALALDGLEPDGVVGPVAGDDTIFVAVANSSASTAVIERLGALVGGKTKP